MKFHRYLASAVLLTILAPVRTAFSEEAPVPEPARASDALVDSIGVCTHWTYRNTIYNLQWDKLRCLIGDLGVRTIRDGISPRVDDLWKNYGIKAIVVCGPTAPWDKLVETWKTYRHVIAAFEGPNEVNGGGAWRFANFGYQGDWQDGAHRFQEDLYKHVKNDPDLKEIPVIALSTAYKGAGFSLAPLQGSLDMANAHSYAGGGIPSLSLDFRDSYFLLGPGATLPPLVATECGYHTCISGSKVKAGAQAGVSHEAHKKYIPRQVAEYFNGGYRWAVIYEFGAGHAKPEQEDPEAAFGLLSPDATPKPAYYALKDLISTLSESKWDAVKHQWNKPAPYSLHALSFALQGAPATLHHTLLEKSDGTFELLLWNEVPSFDLRSKKDIVNPDVAVRLVLKDTAALATVSHLGPDAPQPRQFHSVKAIDVKIPDEVVVVSIKLASPLNPAPVNPPARIDVKTTPATADLSWPFASGVDAYWVSVHHRNMGMAQRGADGKARFSATKLLPATTYPFEVVAVSAAGAISAPAKAVATTVNSFPDLVLKSFKLVPENPKAGDSVSFVAVVKNNGPEPADSGVMIGTRLYVDGKPVCWNDKLRGPIAPGQEIQVEPNTGPGGKAAWIVTPGNHTLMAVTDDHNYIVEANKKNNSLRFTLNASPAANAAVNNVNASPTP